MEMKDILSKMGYARTQANFSARELSFRIGMSSQYVAKVERGAIVLTVEKLLSILNECNFPVDKFFYPNPDEYETDMELLSIFKSMPKEKKEALLKFLQD